jgi:hypothetical protein
MTGMNKNKNQRSQILKVKEEGENIQDEEEKSLVAINSNFNSIKCKASINLK